MTNISSSVESGNGDNYVDPEDTEEIKAAKRAKPEPEEVSYTERDVQLYNLGIGAKADELNWVYENADDFAVCLGRLAKPLLTIVGRHSLHSLSSLVSTHLPACHLIR